MKIATATTLLILAGLLFPLDTRSHTPPYLLPSSTLFPFRNAVNGRVGYIDRTGKVVIEPVHSERTSPHFNSDGEVHIVDSLGADEFSAGLAPVRIGEAYGFIGETGKLVIQPKYQNAGPFSDGLARIRIQEKYGYIDTAGRVVIAPQFQIADDFSEGLAAVQIGGKYGYVNTEGKIVIAPRFDSANRFVEGLAPVKIGAKYGYIDRSGETAIKQQFDAARPFAEGLAAVVLEGKYGYIDHSGTWVIKPQFEDEPYGFLREPTEPGQEVNHDFSEGLALVRVDSLYGYIDRKGSFVIKPQFSRARAFSEGTAAVLDDSGWHYVNKRGDAAITKPSALGIAYSFNGGLALVETTHEVASTRILYGGGPPIPGVAPYYVKVTISYAYINKKGDVVFKGSISLLRPPLPPGPGIESYAEPPLVPVAIDSEPKGARVYLIPLLKWDEDSNLINDSKKLFDYLQSTSTPYKDSVYQDVYIIVLERDGKKVPIKKDFNEFQDRTVHVKFNEH